MAFNSVSSPFASIPGGTGGVTVTDGTSWAASPTWVELDPSLDTAGVLMGVCYEGGDVFSGGEMEIEIGKGAAGSEQIIATFPAVWRHKSGASPNNILLPIGIDNLTLGSRIAIRLSKTSSSAAESHLSMLYYPKPIVGTLLTTPNRLRCTPYRADGATVTPNGTAWTYSAYTELIASTSTGIVVPGLVVRPGVGAAAEVVLATGPSGSEIDRTRFGVVSQSTGSNEGGPRFHELWSPLRIPSGTRVSVRLRKEGTDTADWRVKLPYFEEPL